LAVQWLIEHFRFVSSSLLADSFVLRNRQLLVAANRWWQRGQKSFQLRNNVDFETIKYLDKFKR